MVFENLFQKQKNSEPTSPPPPSSSSTTVIKTDNDSQYINSLKDCKPTALEDYGYYFFPERFGQKFKLTIPQRILQSS